MVGSSHYRIVSNSLIHNFQDTILTPRTTSSVVKIVKDEHKVLDILPQCLDILTSIVVIELFDSTSSDNLTPLLSLIKSLITIFQSLALESPQPSSLVGNIQFIVSCFCVMALPEHTSNELRNLDYNKIPLQKV
jgi:hypothetical protein